MSVVGRIPGRIGTDGLEEATFWGRSLEPYWTNHLVCPDRVSVYGLLIWSPVIWDVNSSPVYIQLSFEKK